MKLKPFLYFLGIILILEGAVYGTNQEIKNYFKLIEEIELARLEVNIKDAEINLQLLSGNYKNIDFSRPDKKNYFKLYTQLQNTTPPASCNEIHQLYLKLLSIYFVSQESSFSSQDISSLNTVISSLQELPSLEKKLWTKVAKISEEIKLPDLAIREYLCKCIAIILEFSLRGKKIEAETNIPPSGQQHLKAYRENTQKWLELLQEKYMEVKKINPPLDCRKIHLKLLTFFEKEISALKINYAHVGATKESEQLFKEAIQDLEEFNLELTRLDKKAYLESWGRTKLAQEVYDEARVRYILADISLAGVINYYRDEHPHEPNSQEAVKRWDNGVRVINIDKFERKIYTDRGPLIVYKGTDKIINGLDVKLSTDKSEVEASNIIDYAKKIMEIEAKEELVWYQFYQEVLSLLKSIYLNKTGYDFYKQDTLLKELEKGRIEIVRKILPQLYNLREEFVRILPPADCAKIHQDFLTLKDTLIKAFSTQNVDLGEAFFTNYKRAWEALAKKLPLDFQFPPFELIRYKFLKENPPSSCMEIEEKFKKSEELDKEANALLRRAKDINSLERVKILEYEALSLMFQGELKLSELILSSYGASLNTTFPITPSIEIVKVPQETAGVSTQTKEIRQKKTINLALLKETLQALTELGNLRLQKYRFYREILVPYIPKKSTPFEEYIQKTGASLFGRLITLFAKISGVPTFKFEDFTKELTTQEALENINEVLEDIRKEYTDALVKYQFDGTEIGILLGFVEYVSVPKKVYEIGKFTEDWQRYLKEEGPKLEEKLKSYNKVDRALYESINYMLELVSKELAKYKIIEEISKKYMADGEIVGWEKANINQLMSELEDIIQRQEKFMRACDNSNVNLACSFSFADESKVYFNLKEAYERTRKDIFAINPNYTEPFRSFHQQMATFIAEERNEHLGKIKEAIKKLKEAF